MSEPLPPLKDLDDLLDDRLELPIAGQVYRIEGPDAEIGLWCQRSVAAGIEASLGRTVPDAPQLVFEGQDELDLYRRLLGPVYDQMVKAKLSHPKIKFVTETVIIWCAIGKASAHAYWNGGGQDGWAGKAQPSRPERRAAAKAGTATGAASTTPRRSSGSGTKFPTKKSTPRKAT